MLVALHRMAHHLLALGAVGVLVVIDQPRRVVALQCEHHGQRVAQVVLRQVVHQGLQALVVATDDAARQRHLRVVVEVDASHVGGQVLLLAVLIPAVVRKHVLVHHGLDGVLAVEHAEREGAVVVGLHILALCVVDAVAIYQEVHALHGDARALVHHVAREAAAVLDGELAQHAVVARGVEGNGHGINFDTTLGEAYTIGDARTALVRQFNHLEVAALIGLCGGHRIIIIGYNHVDGGCACAVVEAHVALHAAGVLTLAHRGIGLGGGAALAVVHCLYLIFVGEQRRHARVLVAHVGQARGHFLPRVLTLALHAAQHAEVVDGLVVGAPRQQHTTLARLRQQRLVHRTVVLVVEHALQLRVVDGGVLIVGLRGRGGHEFVALLRPAVVVVLSQFFLTDTCRAKGHHWQHYAVLHIPAIAQFLDNIGNIVMPDAIVIDFVPAYAFVGIVIFAVAGITPCIAIPLIAESSVIHP